MEVGLIDPWDDRELEEWTAVLRASDEELWPELTLFTLSDIRGFARFRSASKRFDLLAAREPGGPMLGVAMMELPIRDNLGSAEVTVAVHPSHRRRGVGTAVVEGMAAHGRADGRRVLNAIVDVPRRPGGGPSLASVRAEGRFRGHPVGEHPPASVTGGRDTPGGVADRRRAARARHPPTEC